MSGDWLGRQSIHVTFQSDNKKFYDKCSLISEMENSIIPAPEGSTTRWWNPCRQSTQIIDERNEKSSGWFTGCRPRDRKNLTEFNNSRRDVKKSLPTTGMNILLECLSATFLVSDFLLHCVSRVNGRDKRKVGGCKGNTMLTRIIYGYKNICRTRSNGIDSDRFLLCSVLEIFSSSQ